MGALTVACVKWGSRYHEGWVTRLRSMVAKHLSIPHEFVCLTDNSVEGIDCRPLTSALTGWWSKLELFKPGQFAGDILYLDLDMVLTASIDGIVEVARTDPSKLWMRDDFSYSMRRPRTDLDFDTRRLLGGAGVCNSSVMAWHGDSLRRLWDEFDPQVMKVLHGDQNYICQKLGAAGIGFLPDRLVGSYKYGRLRNEPTAPVMVFHGNPKMDELPRSEPLRQIWESAA